MSEKLRSEVDYDPVTTLENQLPPEATGFGNLAIQLLYNTLAGGTQLANRQLQHRIFTGRSQHGTSGAARLRRCQIDQCFQVCAEAGCRTRTTEVTTDVVITPALGQRLTITWSVGREHHTCVVVIAAQLTQIKVGGYTLAALYHALRQQIQRINRLNQLFIRRKQLACLDQDIGRTIQSRQGL